MQRASKAVLAFGMVASVLTLAFAGAANEGGTETMPRRSAPLLVAGVAQHAPATALALSPIDSSSWVFPSAETPVVREVLVRVQDEEGKLLPRARISLRPLTASTAAGADSASLSLPKALLDPDGIWRCENLPESGLLVVGEDGPRSGELRIPGDAAQSEFVLTLRAPYRAVVTVVDAAGKPLPGICVADRHSLDVSDSVNAVCTDASGTAAIDWGPYGIPHLRKNDYRLYLTLYDGSFIRTGPLRFDADGRATARVLMSGDRRVLVKVVESDGRPAFGHFSLRGARCTSEGRLESGWPSVATAALTFDGPEVSVPFVGPRGSVVWLLSEEGRGVSGKVFELSAEGSEQTTVILRGQPLAELRVSLLDAEGGAAGACVTHAIVRYQALQALVDGPPIILSTMEDVPRTSIETVAWPKVTVQEDGELRLLVDPSRAMELSLRTGPTTADGRTGLPPEQSKELSRLRIDALAPGEVRSISMRLSAPK